MQQLRTSLVLFAVAVLLAAACGDSGDAAVPSVPTVYLLNLPARSVEIDGEVGSRLRPGTSAARLFQESCGTDFRRALRLRPGSEVVFRSVLESGARLSFATHWHADPASATPRTFEVLARSRSGELRSLWSATVVPHVEPQDADEAPGWEQIELPLGDLGAFAGGDLVLRSRPSDGTGNGFLYDEPCWGNLTLRLAERRVRPLEESARNVVIFLIDTLRADHLEPWNYGRETSPNIAALARESLVFTNASAAASWTKASVGSLMTSRYPSFHGAEDYLDRLKDSEITLAEVMHDAGLRTAAYGFNTWIFSLKFNFAPGFDDFVEVIDRDTAREARSSTIVDEVFGWLDRNFERRFFLYVHTIDPHAPYAPTEEFYDRFGAASYSGSCDGTLEGPGAPAQRPGSGNDASTEADVAYLKDLYDAEIAFNDEQLGRLTKRLRDLGVWDETTFVLVADHGEEFLEHGSWSHGGTLYEEQLHVPLIIKPPKSSRLAPRRIDVPVSLLDVAPTVCDLAGVPKSDRFMGQSLAGLALDERHFEPRYVVAELTKLEDDRYSVRHGSLKYIATYGASVSEELFDLESDPGEQTNLIAEADETTLAQLRKFLEVHRAARPKDGGVMIELFGDGEAHALKIRAQVGSERIDFDLVDSEREGDRYAFVPGASSDREVLLVELALGGGDRYDALLISPEEPVPVTIQLDGRPIDPAHVLIGPSSVPWQGGSLELDPELAQAFAGEPPAWQERPGVWCRIWVATARKLDLDETELETLKGLGYFEER